LGLPLPLALSLIHINAETAARLKVSVCCGPRAEMTDTDWHPIATAPFDHDLELAVVERGDAHALVVRCRRLGHGWANAVTGKSLDVNPTHWRYWREKA
jgi:hypothetical protein